MIRLRPHHLLCMLTFGGEGYSAEFIANFRHIAEQLASGTETVEIVEGPDDICAPLLCTGDCHCHNDSVTERDRLAAEALEPLLGQAVRAGSHIEMQQQTLMSLRKAFAAGFIRAACVSCPWVDLCNTKAISGFSDTVLLMHSQPQ